MGIGSLTFAGHLVAFAGAALLLAMVPGPSMAVVVRQTLRHGRRAAFVATMANELGLLFWALVASLGLSALVAASQAAYLVFRVAGATVLLVLGVQSLLEARRHVTRNGTGGGEPADDGGAADGEPSYSAWRSFRVGTVTILANPKAAVFAASFLPQFVPAHAPLLPTLLALSVIWVVMDTAWWVVLAWAIHRTKGLLDRPSARRRLEQASGTLLIGLGIRLAVEHR